MRIIYSLAIGFYALAVRLASPFNSKAAMMRKGWQNWRNNIPFNRLEKAKVAWFHASSLGEFEQARPVMEAFRKLHPDYRILLTFFSPSGYEIRKNYDGADLVCYLPPDTRRNASDFVSAIHPDIAFFVKYDFWFNYNDSLHRKGIPFYLFSAIFRPSQYFFKPYGRWFARQLSAYSHIFVQDRQSISLLHSIGMNDCSVAGDTRIDRVNDIASQTKSFDIIEQFVEAKESSAFCSRASKHLILIAGSSWEPDEHNIQSAIQSLDKPIKVILAPHMIEEKHLQFIEQLFSPDRCVRYSAMKQDNADRSLLSRQILIIDNIGMLSSLYRYAHVAYIGGGFGKGLHNTLEAAIYGCPVCFGPNYNKFKEARDLIANGGAKTYSRPDQLAAILSEWFFNSDSYNHASMACRDYMTDNLGATDTIIRTVEKK